MTREEHIAALEKYRDGILSGGISVPYDDLMIALDASIAALRGPQPDPITGLRGQQPDPITGLVPCGCGGKAHIINSSSYIRRLYVECDRCDIMLGVEATEDGALQGTYHCDDQIIKDWNHAMGMLEVEG